MKPIEDRIQNYDTQTGILDRFAVCRDGETTLRNFGGMMPEAETMI